MIENLSFWQGLSCITATVSVCSLFLLGIIKLPAFKKNFFFLYFYFTIIIYLQVMPTLSLLSREIPLSLSLRSIPPAQQYEKEYALLQILCFFFFQIPLIFIYFRAGLKKIRRSSLSVVPFGACLIAIGSLIFALLFLRYIIVQNLFFTRLGHWAFAQRIVGLPFADFVIIRSYQETSLFLLGILFFIRHYSRGTIRRLATVSLLINMAVYVATYQLNSRWKVIIFCVCFLGWWLSTQRYAISLTRTRQILGTISVFLVAFYMVIIVMNVRSLGFTGNFRTEYLNPFAFSLVGDSQGIYRLNGIDLMARMLPQIHSDGPAWGVAWQSYSWLVRRFFDPSGFDDFRLSLATTSKTYLMSRYLNWNFPDYHSCCLTDLFGNFHIIGFMPAAFIFGFFFAFYKRTTETPISGLKFVLALFFLTHILMFENEAAFLLFGWVRKLPILLLVIAAKPFTVKLNHPKHRLR